MEKTWDDFWASGKVADYLAYRREIACQDTREQEDNGTGSEGDGYGTFRHACR